MKAPGWAWVHGTPLAPAWRRRLEVCLGVVLSAAAVVAAGAHIRPDPAKLSHGAPLVSSPAPERSEPSAERPRMNSEFLAAVRAGDVRAMARTHARGMPLQGQLAIAAESGKKAAVAWLLDHGADVHDAEYLVDSPLLAADADPEITALLRERGAKDPPLDAAVEAIAPVTVARLLAAHPAIDGRGAYLVQTAASSPRGTPPKKRRVIEQLLDAGASPNRHASGSSALAGAVATCDDAQNDVAECMNLVRLLLDHGATLTGDALGRALSLDDGRRFLPLTALLELPVTPGIAAEALANADQVNPDDLERLVAGGVDWTWHDGEEDAALPLFAAVRRGDRDLVRTMLDHHAPVDFASKDGTSALSIAIDAAGDAEASARIVELLVSRGANVNRRLPDGRTPLFAAAEVGSLRVVLFLLAKGARVNERVLDDSALDIAEQNGHLPVARVLDAHGAHRLRPHQVY